VVGYQSLVLNTCKARQFVIIYTNNPKVLQRSRQTQRLLGMKHPLNDIGMVLLASWYTTAFAISKLDNLPRIAMIHNQANEFVGSPPDHRVLPCQITWSPNLLSSVLV